MNEWLALQVAKVEYLLDTMVEPDDLWASSFEPREFSPTSLVLCEDCLTNGFVSRDCDTCGGKADSRTYQFSNGTAVDRYDTGKNLAFLGEAKERRRELERRRDRLIAQLALEERLRAGHDIDGLSRLELQRLQDQKGSYREVRRALVDMYMEAPDLYQGLRYRHPSSLKWLVQAVLKYTRRIYVPHAVWREMRLLQSQRGSGHDRPPLGHEASWSRRASSPTA